MYQHLQYQRGKCRKDTDQEAEYQNKPLFLNILFAPQDETLQPSAFFFCHHLLFADYFNDSALLQFNDTGGFGASHLFPAISYYIVNRRLYFLTYLTEIAR